jgi:hypothetical protein
MKIIKSIKKNEKIFLLLLLIIGVYLRAYNLNWGSPFYFHPDERNIANLIASSDKNILNILFQGTFSYGNFVSNYLRILYQNISNTIPSFPTAILLLRFNSLIFSILLLFTIFKVGNIYSKKTGFLAIIFSVFSVGLIQQSHFGTLDIFITFWIFYAFYNCVLLIKQLQLRFFYYALLALSVACSAKLTSILFLIVIIPAFIFFVKKKKLKIKSILIHTLLGILLLITLVPLLSPYYLTTDFHNLLMSEREIVSGTTPVFYTDSFINTVPIIFQFWYIYPFLLNPLMTILFPISGIYILYISWKKKDFSLGLCFLSFLLLFLPEAFLYTKWTRYMLPTLPFIYIIIAVAINNFLNRLKIKKIYLTTLIVLFFTIGISVLFAYSYIKSALLTSSQEEAAQFSKKNISPSSVALSESYDLGILPFNDYFKKIILFDFYNLETDKTTKSIIDQDLQSADFIVVPSQRVLKTRLLNKKDFPLGNYYYNDFLNNKSKFEKVYQTPCDIFCKIVYLNDPIFNIEDTAVVFDRPTVMIFRILKK